MTEILQIIYVTDWSDNNDPYHDPFGEVLQELDAHVSIQSHLPESYEDIDLLILHPMQMSSDIFETISRSKSENSSIKTVVISSAHGSDLFLQAIDVGVDKYLLKPLLPSAVQKVAERLMRQSLEAKHAQKAYNQINLMFGAISKTSLLIRMEENGLIIEVNDLLCRLLDYQSDTMIGSHWMRFVERRFWVFLRSLVRERLKAGEIYRGIIELVSSKGELKTVDSTIYAIRDKYGEIEEIVCIAQDVSEVNRAILASVEQLIDTESSLTVLFNHSYEAILVNKKYLEVNDFKRNEEFFSSCALCIWYAETSGGLKPITINGATRKEVLESIFMQVYNGEIDGRLVMEYLNQSKQFFTVHISSMPNPMIRSEEYHILYFIDVTPLERLKEDKINDAKLMSVGRLAAAITHEINTPITYIKGNLELLQWECEEKLPETLSLFQPIQEGIARIESIVGSMYEFAGTGKEEMKPCNVHMTLIYALRIVMNRSKHIVPIRINGELFSLTSNYESLGCFTMGISNRLEQVWIIILNNALDEFEKGTMAYENRGIDICFFCNQEIITITIKDNAGGIPEVMLDGIFDFAISGDKKKSMGIGLNVAKAIIEKHGGIIKVSNENQGATFEISLKTYEEKSNVV
ncbi:MAG: PAS domain S-box protein [Sulfuricurvum sp.]|uniref:ATP-binding protein n=1 Tax=Sulfuricurvum sp. TaxID=2025608 RepID=UPI0025E67320|nr:ATP-binding protein [Sulfuricurvum sp.]MBV5321746.1 PAS domain S-box protein [Sulfuricurvum sp.]